MDEEQQNNTTQHEASPGPLPSYDSPFATPPASTSPNPVPPPYAPPYGQAPTGMGGFPPQGQQQPIPRCMRCGTITWWKPAPLLLPIDVIVTLVLLVLFGAGLIYLVIRLINRIDPNRREKICPVCGANNLWTFIY